MYLLYLLSDKREDILNIKDFCTKATPPRERRILCPFLPARVLFPVIASILRHPLLRFMERSYEVYISSSFLFCFSSDSSSSPEQEVIGHMFKRHHVPPKDPFPSLFIVDFFQTSSAASPSRRVRDLLHLPFPESFELGRCRSRAPPFDYDVLATSLLIFLGFRSEKA